MKKLAVYYLSPEGEREKYEIANPTDEIIEHYCWVAEYVKTHREGHLVGLFGARRVLPEATDRQDWLLDRHGIATVRTEEHDHRADQMTLEDDAA